MTDKPKPKKCLYFRSDNSVHGYLRTVLPFETIKMSNFEDFVLEETTFRTFTIDELRNVDAVWFQRFFGPMELNAAHEMYRLHRALGFRMVYDIDDLIFDTEVGNGLPDYNDCRKNFTKEIQATALDAMKLMDVVSVSTEYLGKFLASEMGVTAKMEVIPNALPRAYYGNINLKPMNEVPKKIKVVYIGAHQHFSNEDKMPGDWSPAWIEWLRKGIAEDRIEFSTITQCPYFLDDMKGKVRQLGPVPFYMYHHAVRSADADICINPLKDNQFNSCKSDLALLTCSASGIVCVGTTFKSRNVSPFDHGFANVLDTDTAEQIDEKIRSFLQPVRRMKIIQSQVDFMNSGRWMESTEHMRTILKVLFG